MTLHKHSHGARSLPFKRAYVAAMIVTFIHYMAVVATLTLIFILIRTQDNKVAMWLLGALALVGATWGIGYIFRRAATCPLCKGTPLVDTRAAKHRKAVRLKPLNFGATALLQLTFSNRFRCMYCGTPFDLLRKPGSHHERGGF
ncbi:hypothetical protein [Haloferula rosea]|uniref:Uncharacterized protein n=1 Tax=Haloferula rosea TaxID=490093 RepID=A0A934RBI2_9BACT|nr:hypothetical protein [Haloferula rosea]MBK1826723.1 hypothetical protein [Haloferula rosea]